MIFKNTKLICKYIFKIQSRSINYKDNYKMVTMSMMIIKFFKGQRIKILIMLHKIQKQILQFKNKSIQLKVKSKAQQMLLKLNKINGKLTILRRDSLMEILS